MSTLSVTKPTIGQPNATEDPKTITGLTDIETWGNGNIESGNMTTATRQQLGISDGAVIRRGKSIIATTESRTNVAYGLMATPDSVSVVLPTDGLIFIAFQGTWQESVNGAALASIFIGANQITMAGRNSAAPPVTAASLGAGAGAVDKPLATWHGGLVGTGGTTTGFTGDLTTGQIIGQQQIPTIDSSGGPCVVFAAAGTYAVSIQSKSSSGSVTFKNRKLWVWTVGF